MQAGGFIKARSLYPLMQDDITEIDARLTSITEMDLLKRIETPGMNASY